MERYKCPDCKVFMRRTGEDDTFVYYRCPRCGHDFCAIKVKNFTEAFLENIISNMVYA